MARTDAHAVEGQQAALDRAAAYAEAGADMIFAEALTTLDEYRAVHRYDQRARARQPDRVRQDAPVHDRRNWLTPACAWRLYPLTAFRAMSNDRAGGVFETLRDEGTQAASVVDAMQTRMELYDVLGYQAYEDKLDELFKEQGLKTGER